MHPEITSQILSFARHLDDPRADPMQKAMERRWLDAAGQPTADGMSLAQALHDQIGTRSCFRHL